VRRCEARERERERATRDKINAALEHSTLELSGAVTAPAASVSPRLRFSPSDPLSRSPSGLAVNSGSTRNLLVEKLDDALCSNELGL
jgi:hypothetical protein